jgi:hypothetical protein
MVTQLKCAHGGSLTPSISFMCPRLISCLHLTEFGLLTLKGCQSWCFESQGNWISKSFWCIAAAYQEYIPWSSIKSQTIWDYMTMYMEIAFVNQYITMKLKILINHNVDDFKVFDEYSYQRLCMLFFILICIYIVWLNTLINKAVIILKGILEVINYLLKPLASYWDEIV